MPELGRKRDELSPRLRSFPVKNYIIFYRRMASGVEIARILHGARDLPTLFE
jgi:toxin ParE1/3/4